MQEIRYAAALSREPNRERPASLARERSLHTEEVVDSIPTAPTNIKLLQQTTAAAVHIAEVAPGRFPIPPDPGCAGTSRVQGPPHLRRPFSLFAPAIEETEPE